MSQKEQYKLHLIKLASIAIEAFKVQPPVDFRDEDIAHCIGFYYSCIDGIKHREPQYDSIASLKYDETDILTFFNESTDGICNHFWNEVMRNGLPFKRKNMLKNILRRKRIKDDIEFQFVIDVILPYQQQNIIDMKDVKLLNHYIQEFEKTRV